MKKRLLLKSFRLLMISALLIGGSAQAVVNWNGTATNATDEDVDILSSSAIGGGVTVTASTTDVVVDVSADVVLTGTVEPGLCFRAELGRKITVNVDNNLIFTGDADTPLVVTISGPGEVIFKLADAKTVSFTSLTEQKGTKLYIDMALSTFGTVLRPTLRFSRSNNASSAHVHIVVGPDSIMTYISEIDVATNDGGNDRGRIIFEPENTGTGRMELNIKDTGAVYVAGNLVEEESGCLPLFAQVDMTTPAGETAEFNVENLSAGSSANASLLVTNQNETMTSLLINPWRVAAAFDGLRYGFVLGSGGSLIAEGDTFIDYVGLTNNFCPEPVIPDDVLVGKTVEQVVKSRNASALIIDGFDHDNANRAQLLLNDSAALILRSGVDRDGTINWFNQDMSYSFTIIDLNETAGAGEVVFDVEGRLDVINSSIGSDNKIEILSWEVDPTGGSVLIGGSEDKFPLRTFDKDSLGNHIQYNKAYMLVNNRMNMREINLVHTDKNHNVYEKDDINSEPTYVGGETHYLDPTFPFRPMIAFYDSYFYIHTCVAITGMDLRIPEGREGLAGMASAPSKQTFNNNESVFRFFHNGFAYRNGTGRHMILGTQVGSHSCDECCGAISRDAHIDVVQDLPPDESVEQKVIFDTAANDTTIMEIGAVDISQQAEIHTVYLGHASNITIGVPGTPGMSFPTLSIEGNYFSFETRGGTSGSPEGSAITGEGAIFVDANGIMTIDPDYRASVATMIVKSSNGSIDMPRTNVFYDNRIGIADWNLDLTVVAQRNVIDVDEKLSDYTLNWRDVTKDFDNFTPYEVALYDPCNCPAVTEANVASLPTVYGSVNQFQIKGSRLGSSAHLAVDDGWIRELNFLNGCDSADAPTAVVVVKNHGRVGLGSAHRNRDSLGSSIVLGTNGVTIIADGDGCIDLNEDIIINNICHIMRGPNFDPESPALDKLTFYSDCCKSLIVKAGGVLDMSSFSEPNHFIELAGNMKLLLEPGSTVVWGGGVLRVTDNARIESTSVRDLPQFSFGDDPASIDPISVKLIGEGKLQLDQDSVFFVGDDSYVSVQTDSCYSDFTDLHFEVNDRAQVLIGSRSGSNNSTFQIGNTSSDEAEINFKLSLDGVESLFDIASRGFFGLGVGVVNNFFQRPTDWLVDTLFNVNHIEILVPQGTFDHSRIFSSDDPYASLLAIIDFNSCFGLVQLASKLLSSSR